MVLFLIGLGLGDESDITLKGLNALRSCSRVFLEEYTAILTGVSKERLQSAYQCADIITADREMVESGAELILAHAADSNVAFLVVGDPFAATTHHDLLLRAASAGIAVEVVHNASIVNAVGVTGLQLYAFGQIVSIPFFRDGWRPDSWYDRLQVNAAARLHSLCLLDIKVKEQTADNMAKGIEQYEPPRYMTVNQCIEQLLEVEERRKEGGRTHPNLCTRPRLPPFVHSSRPSASMSPLLSLLPQLPRLRCGPSGSSYAKVSSHRLPPTVSPQLRLTDRYPSLLTRCGVVLVACRIVSGTLEELLAVDFGPPLHSLVLAGELHFIEREMFEFHHWDRAQRTSVRAQEKAAEGRQQQQRWEAESRERRVQDEQRKRELLQRKEEEKRRREAEVEEQKRAAEQVRHSLDDDDDKEQVVELEPLL